MGDLTAERVALNDALFRETNERIRAQAELYELTDAIPFICECADPRCTIILRLDVAEYEHVRSDSTWFLNAPGHETSAGGNAEAAEHHGEYDIVRKVGRAADIVEQLDRRTNA
jgi:hypothetical protein